MTTIPAEKTEVTLLLDEAELYGIKLEEASAEKLLALVGNRGVCMDALLMETRPGWLVEIVGETKKK